MLGLPILAAGTLLIPSTATAGPPYETDDPEPVEYRHWEFYVASHRLVNEDGVSGTAPHFEVNYGAHPSIQLHVIVPFAYARPPGGPTAYGPGDIEVGAKIRLLDEGRGHPMVGTFILLELPKGDKAQGLGNGHTQAFIPLWLQKSFGRWTTYGGGGYGINPGAGNRNWWFAGWLGQRQISQGATIGAEVVLQTADRVGGRTDRRFNLGFQYDFREHHHLLFSAGRSIRGETRFEGYAAYQLTI